MPILASSALYRTTAVLSRCSRKPLSLAVRVAILTGSLLAGPAQAATIDLLQLNGSNGFRVDGQIHDVMCGVSASAAGDINGDGIDDLVFGADGAYANGSRSGSSYVLFGKTGLSAFPAQFPLSGLNGSNGFTINGESESDGSGNSVAAAGDVNGDSIGDLIIGAYKAPGGSARGRSYVVFGRSDGFVSSIGLGTLNGSLGFRLDGTSSFELSGRDVDTAGDVNGDGIDDVIVASVGSDQGGANAGSAYIVFGRQSTMAFPSVTTLSSLNGSNGFRLDGAAPGDRAGVSAAYAGDVNGDGIDDIIVGADQAGLQVGWSYVVFGRPASSPFASAINLGAIDGVNGFRLDGVAEVDLSGRSVSSAGDVNGDGIDDLIVGAIYASPNGSKSGSSYVIFGRSGAGSFASNVSLGSLDGSNGFRLDGAEAHDYVGRMVSNAGDFNGDGFDDVIVGTHHQLAAGIYDGDSYVVFGRSASPPFASSLVLSTLDGSDGLRISGSRANDVSGHSVAPAGDINGDGFDDIVIGAAMASFNGQKSGSVFVVFGNPDFGTLIFRNGLEQP